VPSVPIRILDFDSLVLQPQANAGSPKRDGDVRNVPRLGDEEEKVRTDRPRGSFKRQNQRRRLEFENGRERATTGGRRTQEGFVKRGGAVRIFDTEANMGFLQKHDEASSAASRCSDGHTNAVTFACGRRNVRISKTSKAASGCPGRPSLRYRAGKVSP
jgi:hypothetical protein